MKVLFCKYFIIPLFSLYQRVIWSLHILKKLPFYSYCQPIDHQNHGNSQKSFFKQLFFYSLTMTAFGWLVNRSRRKDLEIFDKTSWLKIIADWVTKKLRQRTSVPFRKWFYRESSGDHSWWVNWTRPKWVLRFRFFEFLYVMKILQKVILEIMQNTQ